MKRAPILALKARTGISFSMSSAGTIGKNADFENFEARLGEQAHDFALALAMADDRRDRCATSGFKRSPTASNPASAAARIWPAGPASRIVRAASEIDSHVGKFASHWRRTEFDPVALRRDQRGLSELAAMSQPDARGPIRDGDHDVACLRPIRVRRNHRCRRPLRHVPGRRPKAESRDSGARTSRTADAQLARRRPRAFPGYAEARDANLRTDGERRPAIERRGLEAVGQGEGRAQQGEIDRALADLRRIGAKERVNGVGCNLDQHRLAGIVAEMDAHILR